MSDATHGAVRCPRCGKLSAESDKFCAECGRFLRDASIDQRLLLALVHEREGRRKRRDKNSSTCSTPSPITSWATTSSEIFFSTKVCWTSQSNIIAAR